MNGRTPQRFDLMAWLSRGQRPVLMGAVALLAVVVGSVLGLVLLDRRGETADPSESASPVAVVSTSPTATKGISPPPTPSPTATPMQTLTPSPTASPTPTATPTATASPTATPTPPPTATPTPRPTATPTARPTATAAPTPLPPPGPDAIAFHLDEEIWTINADGTDLVNRTNTPTIEEGNPVWSAEGAYLAFQSWADGGGVEVMNADGSGRRRVADGFARNAGYFTDSLAWAPDGDRLAIAFVTGDVAILDVASGERIEVGEGTRWLAWSPSGRYLAWGRRGVIWAYDSDAGETFVVAKMDSNIRFLDWFPDEERLLFIGFEEGNADLFTVNFDGSGLTNVLPTDAADDGAQLSAGGTQVLFSRAFPSTGPEDDIVLLELGATEPTSVLEADGPGIARWAPDDARAVAERDGTIYLLPLDGSDPVEITEGSAPVWRPSP